MTHIVHYVYDSELPKAMDAATYIKQLFEVHQERVTQIFRNHFKLNDDFHAEYFESIGARKRTMTLNYEEHEGDDRALRSAIDLFFLSANDGPAISGKKERALTLIEEAYQHQLEQGQPEEVENEQDKPIELAMMSIVNSNSTGF